MITITIPTLAWVLPLLIIVWAGWTFLAFRLLNLLADKAIKRINQKAAEKIRQLNDTNRT